MSQTAIADSDTEITRDEVEKLLAEQRAELREQFEKQLAEQREELEEQYEERLAAKDECIAELQSLVKSKREEKEKLRKQVEDLKQAVKTQPIVEFRNESDGDATLDDLWIGSKPVGKIIDQNTTQASNHEGRITDLEWGEVDVDDVLDHEAAENQLPIQRDNAARKADAPADLSENRERATHVWAAFHERSRPGHGKLRMPSWLVKQILDNNECPTNPNTVRRVMEFVAKGTGQSDDPHPEDDSNLITLKRGDEKNTLVADQDEWEAFFAEQMQQATSMNDDAQDDAESDEGEEATTDGNAAADDVNVEMDALSSASAVTSDENDSVDGEITVS